MLFDFPGQGRAQIISGSAVVSLDEQVEVLHQVLAAQNVPEKSIVAGASWGGVVVAAFASRFPQLVDKIILASFGIRVNEKLVQAIQRRPTIEWHCNRGTGGRRNHQVLRTASKRRLQKENV